MKAPDKIYARIVAGKLYASREPHKIFDEPLPEYIRKEALLEWAKENQKDAGPFTTACYQVFVDKLNEM